MSDLTAANAEDALQLLKNIDCVEKEFLKHEQVPCPVVHSFGPGVYLRQVTVPAGSFVIGHHQNFEHMNIFLKGKVSMLSDSGAVSTIAAPMTFVAKPGRKIGYVHEDMVWINVYSTIETDIEKLEAQYITKSDVWVSDSKLKENIKMLQHKVDNDDYLKTISDLGFDEKTVREQAENNNDIIDLPFGSYKIKVSDSNIEGRGLFATADILEGEVIAPARINSMRTIAGRFANHSVSPNAKMVRGENNDIYLVATNKIMGCAGGIDGEEITINYRDAFKLNLEIKQGELCRV